MASLSSTTDRLRSGHAATALVFLGTLLAAATFVFPEHSAASPVTPAATSTTLVGTLQLTAGSCSGGKVRGTYLRMILPSGHAGGPYMSNSDSTCSDQSYTPLSPGSDGGLRVGSYQPTPTPAFSASGDAKARRITAPAPFYGTSFATATSPVDPQTKRSVPAPSLTLTGSTLSADLRSFAVTWNNQNFNQGAPKPDGSTPGNTQRATGTYNAATGAFTLNWASQVVGGPFDKFTGAWHFEGRFVPAAGPAPTGSTGHGSATTSGGGGATGGGTGTVPGAPVAAGTPASPGAPAAVGVPGAVPVVADQGAAPTTRVVTTDKWKVSWPVIGLAVGIGLLALGGLVLTSVLSRRAEAA